MDPLPLRFCFKQASAIKAEPPQFPFCATFSLVGGLNWMLGWEKLWSVFKLICTLSVKLFCIISSSQDTTRSCRPEDLFFFFPADLTLFFFSQILLLFFPVTCWQWNLVCNGDSSKPECRTECICSLRLQGKAGSSPELSDFDPCWAKSCHLTNTVLAEHFPLWLLHQ